MFDQVLLVESFLVPEVDLQYEVGYVERARMRQQFSFCKVEMDLLWINFLPCSLFDDHETNTWRGTYRSTVLKNVSNMLRVGNSWSYFITEATHASTNGLLHPVKHIDVSFIHIASGWRPW